MKLAFYEDPRKIRKKLIDGDLRHLSQLLLPWGCMMTHMLQWMGEQMVWWGGLWAGKGWTLPWGMQTWAPSSGSCSAAGRRQGATCWTWVRTSFFVKRQGLEISGMLWDSIACKFCYRILCKDACGAGHAVAWVSNWMVFAIGFFFPEYWHVTG